MSASSDTTIISNMSHESYLDRILKEIVRAECMWVSNPMVQSKERDPTKSVLQIDVRERSEELSEDLFFCSLSSWALIRALVQLLSQDGFIVFGVCHARFEANGDVSVRLMHSLSNAGCVCCRNGLIWFHIPLKYSSEFQLVLRNNFNLDVIMLHGTSNEVRAQDKTYISESEVRNVFASLLFGSDAVLKLQLVLKHPCQMLQSFDPDAGVINDRLEKKHCNTLQSSSTIEVADVDLLVVKSEIKREDEGSDGGDCLVSEESVSGLETLCKEYFRYIRRRRSQFLTSESALIVKCPGCTAEFRGLTDRLCRLVRHIESHEPHLRKQYMTTIGKRYRSDFDKMKQRIKFKM